jgi:D-aspartate ligase
VNGAVVIGGDFQGLGVIRSLAEMGVPVFLIEHEKSIGRYSRYVKRSAKNYSLLSEESFTDYLISLAKKESLKDWVLFPNDDECVKLLSLYRERLSEWYRVPVPDWTVTEKFYFKKKAYEFAEKINIPIPRSYYGSSVDDFINQDLNYPVILKPTCKEIYYPDAKKKAVRANDAEMFKKEFEEMLTFIEPSEIVVQEMIEGGPKNLYSFATLFDGEKVLAGLSANRLRQHPMDFGHATTYAVSMVIDELETLSTKILKEMRYQGIAEVEFMKDPRDDKFKFIEINGRPWGWHTLVKASGINLPYMLFQFMNGEKIDPVKPQENVKWLRISTDFPTVLKEIFLRRMSIKEYFKSLKGKKEFAVLSLKDPLPFLMEYFLIPYLLSKRGF